MSEIFADVPSEGAGLEIDQALDRLSTKEDKTASESQPEKKEVAKEEVIPFHKHPRWQKTQAELKETREKLAKLEQERTQNQPTELPGWWKKQYGETEESKARYQAVTQKDGELEWIKSQILSELDNRVQTEQTQIKQGEEYVNTQLEEMSSEGLKFDRNGLLKFMVDFQAQFGAGALLDSEGNYDFRKSLTLMERMQPKDVDNSTTIKKQLASQGSRGKAAPTNSKGVPVISRNALRRGNWRDVE